MSFDRLSVLLSFVLTFVALAACGGSASDPTMTGNADLSCSPSFSAGDACGGALDGTFGYRAVCASEDALAPLKQACPSAAISNEVRATAGTLRFAASTYQRHVEDHVTGHISVPAECTAQAGSCAGVKSTIESMVSGTTASCTGSSACECDVDVKISTDDSGSYAASNGTATVDPGSGDPHQYWYCTSDSVLRYRDMSEQITYVLVRQ